LGVAEQGDGRTGLQGELTERELADSANFLRVNRAAPAPSEVWSKGEGNVRIEQTILEISNNAPQKLIVVIDGSVQMTAEWTAMVESLAAMNGDSELRTIVATDAAANGWMELTPSNRGASMIEQLRSYTPIGGQDNIPALRRGWDLAAENGGNVLLWIHAPIPVQLESTEGLHQRLERNVDVVRFVDFQIGNGPNRVIEKLDGLQIATAFRKSSVADDLQALLSALGSEVPHFGFVRKQWTGLPDEAGEPASKHVARLWALSEVRTLAEQRKFDHAIKLARDYQLVTPLTGAVVLETQAQYDASGLSPVDAASVPVVPEPSVVMLLLIGVAVWVLRNRVRRTRSVS
jgi:hypothetical protein